MNGKTSANLTGLSAGRYIVTVTDSSRCYKIDSVLVGGISGISDLNAAHRIRAIPKKTLLKRRTNHQIRTPFQLFKQYQFFGCLGASSLFSAEQKHATIAKFSKGHL